MSHTFKNLDEFETISAELAHRYNELIFQLKEKESNISVEALAEVKERKDSELLLFILDESEKIAGMAQLSYHCTPSHYVGYVNTVVIDETYRGQGLGALIMNELERRSKERWSNLQGFALTSAPKRGTQGFYVKLGYKMRTKEEGDETTVFVKEI